MPKNKSLKPIDDPKGTKQYSLGYNLKTIDLHPPHKHSKKTVELLQKIYPDGLDHGKGAKILLKSFVNEILSDHKKNEQNELPLRSVTKDFMSAKFMEKINHSQMKNMPNLSQVRRQQALKPSHSSKKRKVIMNIANRLQKNDGSYIRIRLNSEHIDDELLCLISKGLIHNHYARQLILHDNDITDEGIKELCTVLVWHPSLNTLWIGANKITDMGLRYIINLLERNPNIVELNLSNKWPSAIWSSIDRNLHPCITSLGAEIFAKMLQNGSTNLTSLSFSDQRIRDTGASAIFQALSQCKLRVLNLNANKLSDSCCKDLFVSLSSNQTLEKLVLNHNHISNDGAIVISLALFYNSTLLALDLGYNRIDQDGIDALYDVCLECNQTLHTLITINNTSNDDKAEMLVSKRNLNVYNIEVISHDMMDEKQPDEHELILEDVPDVDVKVDLDEDELGETVVYIDETESQEGIDGDFRNTISLLNAKVESKTKGMTIKSSENLPLASIQVNPSIEEDDKKPASVRNNKLPKKTRKGSILNNLTEIAVEQEKDLNHENIEKNNKDITENIYAGRRNSLFSTAKHRRGSMGATSSLISAAVETATHGQYKDPHFHDVQPVLPPGVGMFGKNPFLSSSFRGSFRKSISNKNLLEDSNDVKEIRIETNFERKYEKYFKSIPDSMRLHLNHPLRSEKNDEVPLDKIDSNSVKVQVHVFPKPLLKRSLSSFSRLPLPTTLEDDSDPFLIQNSPFPNNQKKPLLQRDGSSNSLLLLNLDQFTNGEDYNPTRNEGRTLSRKNSFTNDVILPELQRALSTSDGINSNGKPSSHLGKTLGIPTIRSIGVKPVRTNVTPYSDSRQHLMYLRFSTENDPLHSRPYSIMQVAKDRKNERTRIMQERQRMEYKLRKQEIIAMKESNKIEVHHAAVPPVPESFWKAWKLRNELTYKDGIDRAEGCTSILLEYPTHIPPLSPDDKRIKKHKPLRSPSGGTNRLETTGDSQYVAVSRVQSTESVQSQKEGGQRVTFNDTNISNQMQSLSFNNVVEEAFAKSLRNFDGYALHNKPGEGFRKHLSVKRKITPGQVLAARRKEQALYRESLRNEMENNASDHYDHNKSLVG